MLELWDRFAHEGKGALIQLDAFIEQICFWEGLSDYLTPDEAHYVHTAYWDMLLEESFDPIVTPVIYIEKAKQKNL